MGSESLDYFPFFPKDFASDGRVEAMTTEAVGAYILLLCKAWHETPPGSIPNDDPVLARWARLEPDRWADCRFAVLSCWTLDATTNRYFQKRLVQEHRNVVEMLRLRARAGRKGATARWQTHGKRMAEPCHADLGLGLSSGSEGGVGETRPRTPRDDLWDAVAGQWFGGKVAKPQMARVGKIVNDLLDLEATPDELRKRTARYRAEWPKAECTGEAVVKHWARFDGRGGVARRPATGLVHPVHQAESAVESPTVPQDKLRSIAAEVAAVRAKRREGVNP